MGIYGTGTAPKTELLINNVWTDVSSKPRAEQKIVITRGRQNEQSSVSAQTCQTSINNRDGLFSNRNPNSMYYGLLPRNTQMRVAAGAGDNYLKAVYSDTSTLSNVTTADKAVLDITGDIDIRCDVQPYSWTRSTFLMPLAVKGTLAGNQLSWAFAITSAGFLALAWYPSGTGGSQLSAVSTSAVPATSRRLTVRVTLDVNNGAAGNTATFYTSDSVTGTFTQLGSTVVQAGTTSIFSSSSPLTMAGGGADTQGFFINGVGFGGRFYRGQVYDGIGGTLRADMNATARSVGDTTWSDGLGTPNTWTLVGTSVRLTTDRLRFWGELSSLPQVWDLTGRDVYVPVTASGIIRRLTQGASPLSSPMYRNFNQYAPLGYWPLEDGSTATSATSATGGTAAQAVDVTFGASAPGLPGTTAVAQLGETTSALTFTCPPTTPTGTISVVFYVKLSVLPATGTQVLARINTSGTIRQITVSLTSTTWVTEFFDSTGTSITATSVATTDIDPSAGWIGYNLLLQTSGGNVTSSIRWDIVGVTAVGVGPTVVTAGTVGVPTATVINTVDDAAFVGANIGQVFFSTQALNLSNASFRNASSAWLGEAAANRITRLALEEDEPVEVWGIAADSEIMGYQTADTFMNLLYDCASTDGGLLSECRDRLAICYRTRTALENRSDVTLDYEQSHLSEVPLPTEDDQAFTNDVTVSRPDGASARAQNTDGPTSVSPPPVGVGRYATSVTRNVGTQNRLPSVAGWAMLVGSWDDARYPSLAVGLHRTELTTAATLTGQVIALDLGDTAVLTNLPAWLPPDDVPELLQGYTETLDKFTWTIKANASPAGPYQSAVLLGNTAAPIRLDAVAHSIGGSMTNTSPSVTFVTPAGSAVWVDSTGYPAEFPFNAKIAGEVVTVTAISGTTSPQTATLTRSVNGIIKTHNSGELIRLAAPYFIGR